MKTNRIIIWFRSQKGWVLSNLAWSAIAFGVGLMFLLIAHFIPFNLIELWVLRSAGTSQAMGTLQALVCGMKAALYMWALSCFGVAVYANVCWIGTFFLDACGIRGIRRKL